MTQKVLKVGTSVAVTIPSKLAEDLGFVVGAPIEVSVDRKTKTVSYRPQQTKVAKTSAREVHVAKLTFGFIERYRKDLDALKDK